MPERSTLAVTPATSGVQTLVLVDNVIIPQTCALYRAHRCAVLETHHICPQSWYKAAGQPVTSPLIEICPNCHGDTHAAIDAMLRHRGTGALPPRCVRLAGQALTLAGQSGLTPRPTL